MNEEFKLRLLLCSLELGVECSNVMFRRADVFNSILIPDALNNAISPVYQESKEAHSESIEKPIC